MWINEVVCSAEMAKYSENTISALERDLMVFSDWFEEENGEVFLPEKLTNYDVRRFRKFQLEQARVSAATWNRRMWSLGLLADWCQARGYVKTSPMEDIEGVAVQALAPKWLSKSDWARFMRQVERDVNAASTSLQITTAKRDQAMVGFMAFAGLREGELVQIRATDVVLRERSGWVLLKADITKGEKERIVPLSREARRMIEPWMDMSSSEVLFPMTERNVQLRVRAISDRAGCDAQVAPHMLRHSFAKRMADKGVRDTEIADLLGHSSLDTTKRYTRPGIDDLAEAVELV
ncbi:MAG: tyrosine-type recombinase/integrase [Anaerolineae bacterium]|nr:tyrosine-type recombinase/integrase [Anaerolineae bacterium]